MDISVEEKVTESKDLSVNLVNYNCEVMTQRSKYFDNKIKRKLSGRSGDSKEKIENLMCTVKKISPMEEGGDTI